MIEKVQQKRGEKTKQEILAAAANVFIAKGYEGASISDIAAQKEINQSLIYHYFKDKKALWHAVKDWLLADFLALCQEAARSHFHKKKFFALIVQQFHYLAEHPDVFRFMLWQQMEEKSGSASLEHQETLTYGLAMLQARKEIDESLSPELAALFITCLLQGALQPFCTLHPVDLKKYSDALENNLEKAFLVP